MRAEAHGALIASSNVAFAIRIDRGRCPDIDVYLAGATRPPKHAVVRVPPSIIVEVVDVDALWREVDALGEDIADSSSRQ